MKVCPHINTFEASSHKQAHACPFFIPKVYIFLRNNDTFNISTKGMHIAQNVKIFISHLSIIT